MAAPPATGQRITWTDLPDHVRAGIERVLGGRVVQDYVIIEHPLAGPPDHV